MPLAISPITDADVEAVIALWQRCGLTRPWNDPAGDIAYRFDRVVEHRVISEETATTMAHLLNGVTMEGGGGVNAAIPGYEVAGKTGTAQKIDPNGHGYLDHHHVVGSFIEFSATRHQGKARESLRWFALRPRGRRSWRPEFEGHASMGPLPFGEG